MTKYIKLDDAQEIIETIPCDIHNCHRCVYESNNACNVVSELCKLPYIKRDGWILCSEKLPEMFEEVVVCQRFKNGDTNVTTASRIYPIGMTDSEKWFWCNEIRMRDVIAWMPLPEPYKAD